jgi:hypothetical protein
MDLDKRTFTLRINDDLLNKLSIVAKKDRRSTNTKILTILEKYIKDYEKRHGTIKSESE